MRKTVCVAYLAFLCAGCGSSISVSTDWDRSHSFADLSTYAWSEHDPPEDVEETTIVRIQRSTDAVLQEKGFRRDDEEPSFLVAYQLGSEDRHRYARYNSVRVIGTPGTTREEYTEGTIVIDVIDPQSGEAVWRGSGKSEWNPAASPEETSKLIREAIEKILADFPPDA